MLARSLQVFSGASGAAVMRGRTIIGPVIVKFWCGLKVSGVSGAPPCRPAAANGHVCVSAATASPALMSPTPSLPGLPQGGYKQTNTANEVSPECPTPNIPCKDKGGLFGHSECNFRFLNSLQRMTDDANLTGARDAATPPESLASRARPCVRPLGLRPSWACPSGRSHLSPDMDGGHPQLPPVGRGALPGDESGHQGPDV